MRAAVQTIVLILGASSALVAQNVISAHSGLVHYTEGKVLVAGHEVESTVANFPEVKEKQDLKTTEGRAEVLLTPGVFLRLAENSSFLMISNRLTDSRIEFLEGSALIEAADLLKDNAVTVTVGKASVNLKKNGLYRFDSEPMRLRVYAGEAVIETPGAVTVVKESRILTFEDMQIARFDAKLGDALSRWSRRRAEYIAMANVSAAKSLRDSGTTWNRSGWMWNPYFGMMTFIPYRSSYYSPYGFTFWSPVSVARVYQAPVFAPSPMAGGGYNPNYGYSTVPHTSGGFSGTVAAAAPSHSAPTTTAAGAASAPVARESGSAGGGRR
jgi:hypothetical protein